MSLPIVKTMRLFSETYADETIYAKHLIKNVVQVIVTGNGGAVTVTDMHTTKALTVANGVSRTFPCENFIHDFSLSGAANVECYIKE